MAERMPITNHTDGSAESSRRRRSLALRVVVGLFLAYGALWIAGYFIYPVLRLQLWREDSYSPNNSRSQSAIGTLNCRPVGTGEGELYRVWALPFMNVRDLPESRKFRVSVETEGDALRLAGVRTDRAQYTLTFSTYLNGTIKAKSLFVVNAGDVKYEVSKWGQKFELGSYEIWAIDDADELLVEVHTKIEGANEPSLVLVGQILLRRSTGFKLKTGVA